MYVPFPRPVKVQFPEESAVVEPVAPPLSATVAFAPFADRFPEMLKFCAVAVKLTPPMLPPLIVTVCELGVKAYPSLLGVAV